MQFIPDPNGCFCKVQQLKEMIGLKVITNKFTIYLLYSI
ncbi:hypothetical protein SPPR111872_02070 [Sphingobacterium prati]